MEWGCYAWARGVEESEFYLFLVVFPARCISSVSPRFYFRKHTFCFLPLVAILESPPPNLSIEIVDGLVLQQESKIDDPGRKSKLVGNKAQRVLGL
jgi:hypothetical protein